MDSLFDLVCLYYLKALLEPTPIILGEIKRMPPHMFEHICEMPTRRLVLYYTSAFVTHNFKYWYKVYKHADTSIPSIITSIPSIIRSLSFPLYTKRSDPIRCYYLHTSNYFNTNSYTGEIYQGTLTITHNPKCIPLREFNWDNRQTLSLTDTDSYVNITYN